MTRIDGLPALTIAPIVHAAGQVRLPGSKSISNRALLLAALGQGRTRLVGLLDADDTRVMIDALRTLGVGLEPTVDGLVIEGCGGVWPARHARLFLGNAGTAMRPLAAALAFAGGHYELDGVPRMRERPIGDLVDALLALGARVRYLGTPGFPPLAIDPAVLANGDHVTVKGDVSSQFVSSLLMAAPGIAPASGLFVHVPGTLISQPYVGITVAMMGQFGVPVRRIDHQFIVPRAVYRAPGAYVIEGDASAASYLLALGVLAGGPVRVLGAGRASVQGDVAFADLLAAMGADIRWGDDWIEARAGQPLRAVEHDCTAIPDAAMTAAILAVFASGRTVLRGIGSWRVKETDRIAAMATELAKLGVDVDSGPDWLAVVGQGPARPALREAAINTYDDHRVAMCFALAAAAGTPVHIRDPGCVGKTYPSFFDELARLTSMTTSPTVG